MHDENEEAPKSIRSALGFFIVMMLWSIPFLWGLERASAIAMFPSAPYICWVKLALIVPWLTLGQSGYMVWTAAKRGDIKPSVANSLFTGFSMILLFVYMLLAYLPNRH